MRGKKNMPKVFRPSNRESMILSKIESSKERAQRNALNSVRENLEPMANAVATRLVSDGQVETTSKNSLEEQIARRLNKLLNAENFDIDYQIAPFRDVVANPHVVSLYITAFVLESLINHKDVVDIFGTDEEIYHSIHSQVKKFLR